MSTVPIPTTQQIVNQAYQDEFGRNANFGSLGGGDYWVDRIENHGLDPSDLNRILQASAEGQSVQVADDGTKTSWLGGVNPNISIAQQQALDAAQTVPENKSWASHFSPGGIFSSTGQYGGNLDNTIWQGMPGAGSTANPNTTQNVAGLLNATYAANNPDATFMPYYNNAPIVDDGSGNNNIPIINGGGGGGTTPDPGPGGWWTQFADIDAFKDALGLGNNNQQSGGVDDFMKFMMFMSMLRPQGGGGYGGSQYGYGGLNPGGVMSAYNPLANITSAISAFQSLPGIGTGNVNTGTATATS